MSTLNTTEFAPELALLLQCARHHLKGGCQQQIQQLVNHPELNWRDVIHLARFHRLLPILHKVLFSKDLALDLPDSVLKALRGYQLKNIGRNFSLVQELKSFLEILDTHHIRAITFKGPMTAMNAYGDLSLRMFSDLDLLVHPDDFLKLREIAINQGYQCDKLMAVSERECLKQLSSQEQASYFQSQKEYSLLKVESRTFLDIHQGILSKQFLPLFDTRWIWQHTQERQVGGHPVLGLTPDVEVIVLAAQGAEEYWPQLGKLFDLAMLIENHPNLDWNSMLDLSESLDVLPRLILGLTLIQNLYGVTLPDQVDRHLKAAPPLQALAQEIQENMLNKPQHIDSKLTLNLVLYQLRLMTHWRNRVRCVLTLMNPTLADIAAIPLPKYLFFIYYLFRPVRLIQEVVWPQPAHPKP